MKPGRWHPVPEVARSAGDPLARLVVERTADLVEGGLEAVGLMPDVARTAAVVLALEEGVGVEAGHVEGARRLIAWDVARRRDMIATDDPPGYGTVAAILEAVGRLLPEEAPS